MRAGREGNRGNGTRSESHLGRLVRWFQGQGDGAVIRNATSLVGATLTTAALGAVYWALAARLFPPAALGIAAAGLSTMMLVGQISTAGLGTVLMGELSHHREAERPMIYAGVAIAATIGVVVGVIVIALAAGFVPQLSTLSGPLVIVVFAVGTAATAAGLVLDQALLGLLRGGLQLLRNTVASLAKLGALGLIGLGLVAARDAPMLLATWVFGTVASLGLLLIVHRVARADAGVGRFRLPRGLPSLAARHHVLNLSILAPGLLLPLLVTIVTSAEANAYFYIAYLVAGFAWAGPAALATALYAAGSREVDTLASRVRLAFWLSMAAGVVLNVFMLFGAQPLLAIFGEAYANQAVLLLRLFSLGIFPVAINSLFVPIARIERRFLQGTVLMIASMVIEFVFVVGGGMLGGLDGVGYGWLIGYTLGTLPLVPAVYRIGVRGTVRRLERDVWGRLPALEGSSSGAARPRGRRNRAVAGPDGAIAETGVEPSAVPALGRRPLAIALLTDGPQLSRWQAACARAMLRTEGLALVAWLHFGAAARVPREPAALAPASGGEIPEGMPPGVRASQMEEGTTHDRPYDLVVDLATAGDEAARDIPSRRHWKFAFGPDGRREPLRVGLREIALGRGTIDVSLVDCDEGGVLRRGVLRTAAWSIELQFDQLLLATAAWPAEIAAGLRNPGCPEVERADVSSMGFPGTACADEQPSARLETPVPVLWLAARARQAAATYGQFARHDHWNVGLVDWPIGDALNGSEVENVAWLPRRRGRYAADPFGIERGGQLHVLFEDFDLRLGRAVISASTFGPDGEFSDPEPVLDAGSHASYPFLLEDEGEVWMIPETTEAREVRLYRALELPGRWKLECRLLTDIQVSDPTIVRTGGLWWMFGTSRSHGVDHALRIWHAPVLTGPWSVHRQDPVKFDARSARPGGTPFLVKDVLYRPAQDCSKRYGGCVVINRVDVLAPDAFCEVPVATVVPQAPYPDGLHTLSAVGARTLIDSKASRFIHEAIARPSRETPRAD